MRAITPFSFCFARICTTAPPSLHPHYRDFLATMQDSDSCPRRFGLPRFRGCAARWGLCLTRTGLPGYPVSPSQHAISADTAGTLNGLQRLSRPLLTAFATCTGARLSGSICFDAHLMEFIFIMACWFRRCPACGFGLAASFRASLSVVNRLIRPEGLSPSWLPASPAHVQDKFLRDLPIGVFWEHVSFCATTWLHPTAQGCPAAAGLPWV